MAFNCHLTIIFIGLCLCSLSTQSTSRYSLQTAINYLNEPLRKSYLDSDKFLVNPYLDTERGYEGYYDDNSFDDEFDDRKRSLFRKRGTVFRERTRQPSFQHKEQEILAEKFLKAIEEEREREEEEEYQQQLRNLWSRYQVEEDDIERELFDNDFNDDDAQAALLEEMKRKRQRGGGEIEVAPSYWNQKRTMPLLPWLPAQKKKRFPVAKRSPKEISPIKEQHEKPSEDLKSHNAEIPVKKKRSDDAKVPLASANVSPVTSGVDKSESQPGNMMQHVHVHEKRDITAVEKASKVKRETSSEEDEEDDDTRGHAEVESEPDTDEEAEEEEDDEQKKKKKRDTSKTAKSTSTSSDKTSNVSKRPSFEWSDLFGLDRKKKSILPTSRRSLREEKLEEMERKLKKMEDYVLQDTAKYVEIPEDNLTPSDERAMKVRVSQRLAAIYSLEKLRKAVQRLRESIELGNNFIDEIYGDEEKKKAKRVAVKKEKAEFDNKDHDIDSSHLKVSGEMSANDHRHDAAVDKKRKKKRNELTNFISENEPMSEEMMGGGGAYDASSCPILDSIERKCRGIDMMNGDFHQNLLDTCGAHQLCYLCGDSQAQCDYDFLAEAEEMCDSDMKCNIIARQTLSALKSAGAVKISQRECIRNPCIRMALQTLSSY